MRPEDRAAVDDLMQGRRDARERLASRSPGMLHLALADIDASARELRLSDLAYVRALDAPPGVYALGWAIEPDRVRHELVVNVPMDDEFSETALAVGQTLVSALQLFGDAVFLVPAGSDHAWDTIDGAETGSPNICVMDAFVAKARPSAPYVWNEAQCEWAGAHHDTIARMRANRNFDFALECYRQSASDSDVRMAITRVWAGIEGLMGVEQELRFRLATLCAALLDPPGTDRAARYRAVLKLYDIRSKVVHGSASLSRPALTDHLAQARSLLSAILREHIAIERSPTRVEVEDALFGVPLSGSADT